MSFVRLGARGASAFLLVTAVLGLAAAPAAARPRVLQPAQSGNQPVIDRAPKIVSHRGTTTIKGHLEGGSEGDYVALERRLPRAAWEFHATEQVDENLKVRFVLKEVRRSARFRLMWTDGTETGTARSAEVRIGVRPFLSLHFAPRRVYAGREVKLWGSLQPFHRGRRFVFQVFSGWGWRTLAKLRAPEGKFVARIRTEAPSRRAYRVRFRGDRWNAPARAARSLYVYDPDLATWYGPGLYGNGTACGQTLTPETMGVAHRTLPCGTMVSVYFRGRSVTVPVIDRGPYSGAEWDLTNATAQRLGFSGAQTVGTIY